MASFSFELVYQSKKSRARVGRIHTPHGVIDTPGFVPVATNATLKGVDSGMAEQLGIQLLFCNTYHLLLHPGPEVVAAAGGLHKFMGRTSPIITDSGGFQVFSLAYGGVTEELKSKGKRRSEGSVLKISEDGVLFRSYRDGTPILLTPESSVQAQKLLGADIIIPLDELPPYHTDPVYLKKSFDRTHRWEERSLQEHLCNPRNQAMYAVVHGGVDPVLRAQSAQILSAMPFDGMSIGGSLGKTRSEMVAMLQLLMPHIPYEKPVHLLGIGDILSLESCIPLGIDTFDCSHPTRAARHGLLLTSRGPLKILQGRYRALVEPVDPACDCTLCANYSCAYLHHLFKAHEMTGVMLASIHNLAHMIRFMANARRAIMEGDV